MKFALACSLFVGSEAVSTSDWEAYKQEFNKDYSDGNGDEDGYRRGVFEQNLVDIAALNAREPLAEYGPTVLSDMTDEEFKAAYLSGYIMPSNSTLLELPVDTSLELSGDIDWTGKYTTPIKDQGHCGSCWAFSAMEQVESDAMREHGWTGRLSTQELVDCTEAGQGSKRGGCGGGNPTQGYKVLQALGGSVSDNDYRYTHVDGTCKINSYKRLVAVASHKSVGRGSESTMKSYVGSTGPLSVCVDANDWKNYRKGVKTSCGTKTDHCVQIVGYGSDSGTQYWKLRNSWGASQFGENGFMRLAIGKNLCNVANDPTATSTRVLGQSESVNVEVAQSLGEYMASWVKAQEGKHIDRGECWDLANEAIKHAKSAGFKVPSSPSVYAWSSQTVNYKNAQPGDILQFVNYHEKTAHGGKSTGDHHTAVVVKSFDSASCGIEVEEQELKLKNRTKFWKPVHDSVYHPCSKTGGSMTVYRMSASTMDDTVVV